MRIAFLTGSAVAVGLLASAASAQWATYEQETSSRLVADSDLGSGDTEEKDYAHGDFDQDGDIDLVVVRKQLFSTPGRRRNVLFMNEGVAEGHGTNGVLVDRTVEYASAANDGGQGMLDLTNDRDVFVADLDDDGWLDIVTAVTYGDGLPKSISHHRVYINLGESDGQWQGFLYDEPRIPQLPEAPDACHVGVGDVTGDGHPDLYFVTYNSSFEDHLLVNVQVEGEWGYFENQTSQRLTPAMIESAFGSGAWIADMNDDGWNDIVKSENGPVKIIYNAGDGTFDQFETASSGAHYFVSVGHLNDDGLLDLIISDDGQDRYRLNQGNGGDGMANFSNVNFTYSGGGGDDGFGGDSYTADLNQDGFNDVVLTDMDVDAGGCGRRTHIYRNLGNMPNPTLQEQLSSGKVVNIPTSQLQGTHDIAIFDLNGDTWLDMVIGRCSGTAVWINQPPIGLTFSYPDGLPEYLPPDLGFDLNIQLTPIGDVVIDNDTVQVMVSVDGADFAAADIVNLGADLYRATIPATLCGAHVDFYVQAQLEGGNEFRDPPTAPAATFSALSALGLTIAFEDEIEEDVSGWILLDESGPGELGAWEQAEPEGTIFNGSVAAPDEDHTDGHFGVQAFVTLNDPDGNPNAGPTDVDGGPFRLITPAFDTGGGDATVTYARWFFSESGVTDVLTVDISNDDGASWVPVPEHTTGGTGSEWEVVSLLIGDYVEPTAQVRLRFTASDIPNDSITEAGIDDVSVEVLECPGGDCPSDLNGDDTTDVEDLVLVILAWGTDDPAADITGNGIVDVEDLVEVIIAWGDC